MKKISNPKNWIKLFTTVANLQQLLKGQKVYGKCNAAINQFHYGLFVGDNGILYVGIPYGLWEKYKEPFYIAFNREELTDKDINKIIRPKDKENLMPIDEEEGWRYLKIPLKELIDEDDAAQIILEMLLPYMKKLELIH